MAVHVDNNRCIGCGYCINVCPQKAITIENNIAVVHQELCTQCGTCIETCPVGAIHLLTPVYTKTTKGGEKVTSGFGRGRGFGRGFGRGMGFGFRGSSSPWPYVGLGRGGLPRCGYFLSGAGTPPAWLDQSPFYGQPTSSSYAPPAASMTSEEELGYLKKQAEAIKAQLEQIDSKMRDMETKE